MMSLSDRMQAEDPLARFRKKIAENARAWLRLRARRTS